MPAIRISHVSGSRRGAVETFRKPEVTVGRGPANDVAFNAWHDLNVSTRHAEIRLEGDSWVLHDLQSLNGTFVNGERVTRAVLRDGDEIGLGQEGPRLSFQQVTGSTPPAFEIRRTTGPRPAVALPGGGSEPRAAGPSRRHRLGTILAVQTALTIAVAAGVAFWVTRDRPPARPPAEGDGAAAARPAPPLRPEAETVAPAGAAILLALRFADPSGATGPPVAVGAGVLIHGEAGAPLIATSASVADALHQALHLAAQRRDDDSARDPLASQAGLPLEAVAVMSGESGEVAVRLTGYRHHGSWRQKEETFDVALVCVDVPEGVALPVPLDISPDTRAEAGGSLVARSPSGIGRLRAITFENRGDGTGVPWRFAGVRPGLPQPDSGTAIVDADGRGLLALVAGQVPTPSIEWRQREIRFPAAPAPRCLAAPASLLDAVRGDLAALGRIDFPR